jgi:hypothetical protein
MVVSFLSPSRSIRRVAVDIIIQGRKSRMTTAISGAMLSGDEQDQVVQDADDVAARVKSARSAS